MSDIQKLENVQRAFTKKINGCRDLTYWERLRKLKILSLQRRRERYSVIHVWKILNGLAPNDLEFEFSNHPRLGIRAVIPTISRKAQMSVKADYDKSFRVHAAQLFNSLPPDLRNVSSLESFKSGLGVVLEQYPDTPPVTGVTGVNNNSILSWIQRRTHSMQLS